MQHMECPFFVLRGSCNGSLSAQQAGKHNKLQSFNDFA